MSDVRHFFPNSHAFDEEDANIIRDFYYKTSTQDYSDARLLSKKIAEYRKNIHKEHLNSEWVDRFKEIDSRMNLYADLFKIHDHNEYPFNRKTILLDIMLDKAQTELEGRSKKYFIPGVFLLAFSILTLTLFIIYLNYGDAANCAMTRHFLDGKFKIPEAIDKKTAHDSINYVFISSCFAQSVENWFDFTLILVKRIVIGGAMLAVAYVFFALANGCFRESTRLLHRRHSVRYIRLLLYRNEGDLDPAILKEAFGVDDVTTSGFDNIKTDAVLNNLIGRLIDRLGNARPARAEEKS